MAVPLVSGHANGVSLHSFNQQYCLNPGDNLSLTCSSAIEQGQDVAVAWIKDHDGSRPGLRLEGEEVNVSER